MKIVKIKKEYTNKQGEKKIAWQFYVEVNGNLIRINPYEYKENDVVKTSTYKSLCLIAEER